MSRQTTERAPVGTVRGRTVRAAVRREYEQAQARRRRRKPHGAARRSNGHRSHGLQ